MANRSPIPSFAHRLRTRLMLAALLSILVVAGLILIPIGLQSLLKAETNRIDHAVRALSVTIEAQPLRISDVLELGDKAIADGLIVGGAVFSQTGVIVAEFGDRPHLTPALAEQNGLETLKSGMENAVDVRVSPSQSGLQQDLIVRVSLNGLFEESLGVLVQVATTTLAVGTLAVLIVIAILYVWFVRPIERLQASLNWPNKTNAEASLNVPEQLRRDEIGALARTIASHLRTGSVQHHAKLASPELTLDHSVTHDDETQTLSEASEKSIRIQELKYMLEACICLIAPAQSTPISSTAVDVIKIAKQWHAKARKEGLVHEDLVHNAVPAAFGAPEAVKAVVTQVMVAVYGQSLSSSPVLTVTGTVDSSVLAIEVADIAIGTGHSDREKAVDSSIAMAALQTALMALNGSLVSVAQEAESPKIVIHLPAAVTHAAPSTNAGEDSNRRNAA